MIDGCLLRTPASASLAEDAHHLSLSLLYVCPRGPERGPGPFERENAPGRRMSAVVESAAAQQDRVAKLEEGSAPDAPKPTPEQLAQSKAVLEQAVEARF